jgi:surface protein
MLCTKKIHLIPIVLLVLILSSCGGSDSKPSDEEPLIDSVPPVITLNGDNPLNLFLGQDYVEPSATATDDIDGELEVSTSGAVNTSELGNYEITYSARDSAGNSSSITRTVIVSLPPDTTPPNISLNGDPSILIARGEDYVELGANAVDDVDGDVVVSISGEVNTNISGTYVVTYSASDIAGNIATIDRAVRVVVPFVTTWKTDNSGETEDNQIKIGTMGTGYDYHINWGDGLEDRNINGDITHTYASPGTYTVSIIGEFPRIFFTFSGYDNKKLLTVEQWGEQQWLSMERAFYLCSELIINATDVPDLSLVTNMSNMFARASSFNQSINDWDVSNVTNMSSMFRGATSFNQGLNNWDVSNVIDMSYMFDNALSFNERIDNWNVSNVTQMSGMFENASIFNQPLNSWNVGNVKSMSFMFSGAYSFNQELNNWDVSSVENMEFMFSFANSFNQDLNSWDVSGVVGMNGMFQSATIFNGDITAWDVGNVLGMNELFSGSDFNQNIGEWDVSSVTKMNGMFQRADVFNQDIGRWDVSNVTEMDDMFNGASQFNQDIDNWDVSKVVVMRSMFESALAFDQSIESWDVSNVTSMRRMFLNVTLSTNNYDALLLGWSNLALIDEVVFDAGESQYSSAAEAARNVLTDTYFWNVIDGGSTP